MFDEKIVKRLLVGLVIFIIVMFIVWRWRTKSEYIYPEATPVGTFAVTAISNEAATATLPGFMKVTTSAVHGFLATGTARDTVIFTGFTGVSAALNSRQFILYNAAGLTTVQFAVLLPPNITITPAFNAGVTVKTGYANYTTLLKAAVDTYNQKLTDSAIGIFISPNTTKLASDAEALAAKNLAYKTASDQYVNNKCPYGNLVNEYIDAAGKPIIVNDPAYALYATYRLTSGKGISKIQNDYNTLISISSSAAVTGTPLNYYANTPALQQARKAYITGATRAYLSTVCPSFYTDVTGSTVETTYRSWDIGGTTYGYNAPTQTQVNSWATYAIDTSVGIVDGKLALASARDLKGSALTAGGVASKPALIGSTVPSLSGITSVTGGTATATVTTTLAHGLVNNSKVIMAGFSPDALNGTFTITVAAATPTVFTFPLVNAPAAATGGLGTITPLIAATITTSPQLIVYTVGTGPTSISKPAWQWARDFGPGTVATTLLPTELRGWATSAPASTASMFVDTTTYA